MRVRGRLNVTVLPETVEKLRELAASLGYVIRTGPNSGKGNISAFLDAIGREELLPPTQESIASLRDDLVRAEKRSEEIVQSMEELKLQVAALRGETKTEPE